MKILFISTVPVFPPIDGVRIPPANYIVGLSEIHDVDFLLLNTQREGGDFEAHCEATQRQVRHFCEVKIRRGSKVRGLLSELLRRKPYYGHWEFIEDLPKTVVDEEYDAVFACTPAAIAIFSSEMNRRPFAGFPRWVAAISDIHSLVLAQLAKTADVNHRWIARATQKFVYGFRSRALTVCEMAMLDRYDYHLVQTDKEADWVRRYGDRQLSTRTVQVTNAVNDQLFALPVERTTKRMAFVGVLSDLYAGRFEWFIHNVWATIDVEEHALTLTAIGRGASEPLQQTMRDNDVHYVDFVEHLEDIYRDHDILIAPIYKGFGLINKVVEAMAAGCVVVGDNTAFNGIPEFQHGKHGFIANTAEEFRSVLTNDFQDLPGLNAIRDEARRLMDKHFRWSQRIKIINEKVLSDSES